MAKKDSGKKRQAGTASSSKKKGERILLTGAAGFIGSHLLEHLFDAYPNNTFMVLDALTYAGDMRNIPERIQESDRFRFFYGDIRNAKIVEHLVSKADVNALIIFSAAMRRSSAVFTCSSRTANSSPPKRAMVSSARSVSRTRSSTIGRPYVVSFISRHQKCTGRQSGRRWMRIIR